MFVSKNQNKEIINRIKEDISITDYAVRLGFTLKKVGRYYTLKEHDSVRIDPVKNKFYRNSAPGVSGSIIDFMIEFQPGINNFHDAMIELGAEKYADINYNNKPKSKVTSESPQKPKVFKLPERDDNVKNVYAYLIGTRHIDKDIVSHLMAKGYIKQDKHKNCMFIGYEDAARKKPVFASLRGTNTDKTFRGDVSGSDYSKGFYIDNGSKTICVTESPIDAMSFMTIYKANGGNPLDYNYLSLSGVSKDRTLYNRLESGNIENVILCLDNDEAGINASKSISQKLENYKCSVKIITPKYKDVNETLCNLCKKNLIKQPAQKIKSISPPVTSCHKQDYDLSL